MNNIILISLVHVGFLDAERRDAQRAARRLERSGFRTQIRSRATAERRRNGGR